MNYKKINYFLNSIIKKELAILLFMLTILLIHWIGIDENGLYECSPLLITLPISIWLLFTKKYIEWR